MNSDPGDADRPEEPAAEHPEPPADFDPAEHPSNPDLVRPDDRPDR